jgi:tryptophan-rich sensory protein
MKALANQANPSRYRLRAKEKNMKEKIGKKIETKLTGLIDRSPAQQALAEKKKGLFAKLSGIRPYIFTYLAAIAIPLFVGIFSALLTKDFMISYEELEKPPLAPPAAVFPIVWTVLYILMGISSATAIISRDTDNMRSLRTALEYYAMSLALNFGWSIIFFRAEAYFGSLIWLLLLLFTVIKTVKNYKKVSKLSAYLQIPYIVWLIFAAYLNSFYALFAA